MHVHGLFHCFSCCNDVSLLCVNGNSNTSKGTTKKTTFVCLKGIGCCQADLVALGRELLWNPNWPIQVAVDHGMAAGWDLMPEQYAWWLRRRRAQQGS